MQKITLFSTGWFFLVLFMTVVVSGSARADTTLTISIDPIVIETASAEECKLRWTNPTEREDGTSLHLSEIKSATIFAGEASGVYNRQVVVVDATEVLCSEFGITNQVDHWFAGIITDRDDVNSKLSDEVTRTAEELAPPISPPKTLFFSGEIVIQ